MPHPIDLGAGFNSLPILEQQRIAAGGGGGGGGGFSGNVIHVDGANDFATFLGKLAGVNSADDFIFNLWINHYEDGTNASFWWRNAHVGQTHYFGQSGGAGILSLTRYTAGAAKELYWWQDSGALIGVGSGWSHILGSTVGQSMWLLINSIHYEATVTNNNTGCSWHRSGPYWLFCGANSQPGVELDFCEYYVNGEEGLDLSQQANVELFRTPEGLPADLGTNGTSVTGNTPTCYFTGDAAAWNAGSANVGFTDNQFTVIGAFTDANTSP